MTKKEIEKDDIKLEKYLNRLCFFIVVFVSIIITDVGYKFISFLTIWTGRLILFLVFLGFLKECYTKIKMKFQEIELE